MTSRRDAGVKARLYTYMTRNPGLVFTTPELMRDCEIRHAGSVNSALKRIREDGHRLDQPVKGSWVYRGEAQAAGLPPLPLPLTGPDPAPAPTPAALAGARAGQLQIVALAEDLVVARDEGGRIWVMRTITKERTAA